MLVVGLEHCLPGQHFAARPNRGGHRIDPLWFLLTQVCDEYKLYRVCIIKEAFLVAAGREHPPAANHLDTWRKIVKAAAWRHLMDVRVTYPDTDSVQERSGRRVLVFNIRRNDYRLVVAAHFDRQIVYALRFMTHAEYSKDRWKDTL